MSPPHDSRKRNLEIKQPGLAPGQTQEIDFYDKTVSGEQTANKKKDTMTRTKRTHSTNQFSDVL